MHDSAGEIAAYAIRPAIRSLFGSFYSFAQPVVLFSIVYQSKDSLSIIIVPAFSLILQRLLCTFFIKGIIIFFSMIS